MKKEVNILFGKRISEIRNRQKISQEELADKCELHRTYIGAIERGEKSPTLVTIVKISKGLNVKLSELFNYD